MKAPESIRPVDVARLLVASKGFKRAFLDIVSTGALDAALLRLYGGAQ